MSQITFQEAPLKMRDGVVGIGEFHNNHWGRMLVLKLLQCDGARYLLIESASNMQSSVDRITTGNGAIDTAKAQELDQVCWKEEGVLRLSTVVYQAQKRGVQVVCADHMCVYSSSYATGSSGMRKRNQQAVEVLLGLTPDPADLKGVIMLNGKAHFEGNNSITKMLQSQPDVNFGWVDASTPESSGFRARLD